MADGAGFWMDVHQMLLDVSIAPSYIKFGHNGGIQHPLLKIIKKVFFSKDTRVATLNETVEEILEPVLILRLMPVKVFLNREI